MIAQVFVWVVETGIPETVENSRQNAPPGPQKIPGSVPALRDPPHCLYDLFATDTGAERHDRAAHQHHPDRDYRTSDTVLSTVERKSQKQHTDKFLSILGTA